MRSASVSEARNNLSALLREVRAGATVTITDHGVPVARLAPLLATTGVPASAIELAQAGRLVLPEVEPDAKWLKAAPAAPRVSRSAVAALLDERATGR
jgi:prevent-host-death family protein